MTAREGKVEYTGRAFEQDATQAMGGDIVRALVELITNADDAYGPNEGEIRVEVIRDEGEPIRVLVRDRAKGLDPDRLQACFGVLGAATSGFEDGEAVRGMLGRGAKDTAAFGYTVFETIKDDTYAWFKIDRKGKTLWDDEPATDERRRELDLPGDTNGLVSTIHVIQPIEVHRDVRLEERMSAHVQLRRISIDRDLIFQPIHDGKRKPSRQIRWVEPSSTELLDKELAIDGYDATARLRLHKLTSPADGRVSQLSTQGIEVRGAKATYDNTFFGETATETSWIRGIIDCTHLDTLIRDYDTTQGEDRNNPIRILSRTRDGLIPEHPFTQALASAVLLELVPILEELRPPKDTSGGGAELREDLTNACKELAKLLKADLDEIDDDPHRGGTAPTGANPLILIPPKVKMAPEAKRSLSLLIHDPAFPEGVDIDASSARPECVQVTQVTESLRHDIYPNTSIAAIRLESGTLGETVVVASDRNSDHSASAEISVQEIHIEPDSLPETLEWKNAKMSVTVGKERSLRLRAPVDLAPTGSLKCSIALDGDGCELLEEEATLTQTNDGWLEGTCKIKGITAGTTCTITATGGEQEAVGTLKASRPQSIGGLGTEIEILDETGGSERGHLEPTDTGYLITIFGRHLGLTELLGHRKANGSFQHEHEPHVRIALAETIASVIGDWLLAHEAARYPHDFRDIDAMVVHRNKSVERYLPPLQRALAS